MTQKFRLMMKEMTVTMATMVEMMATMAMVMEEKVETLMAAVEKKKDELNVVAAYEITTSSIS
jgi:phosphoribosyl-ATP pyrophosphohydrolase